MEILMEFDLLKEIVASVLKVDPKEIALNTTFIDGLGADSLDVFRILMLVEEKFDIIVSKDYVYKINTVEDALKLIKNIKNEQ